MLRLSLADQTFELLPQRGLFWFEQRTLLISDPLFGKANAVPSRGVPYSGTAKASTLNRLTTLLNFFEPDLLLVLGDLVEPAEKHNEELIDGLLFWRRQFQDVNVMRLHNGAPSTAEFLAEFRMKETTENQFLSPFEFQVEFGPADGFVIAGRPHPAIKIVDREVGTGVKAPCFHLQSACLKLPAFCSAKDAVAISPRDGDRVFIVGPNEVVELSQALMMQSQPG